MLAGTLAGHADFVAPEEAGGARVTPRGDIFSLARLVWSLRAR